MNRAAAVVALLLAARPAYAQVDERVMYASVVDDKGQPVRTTEAETWYVARSSAYRPRVKSTISRKSDGTCRATTRSASR